MFCVSFKFKKPLLFSDLRSRGGWASAGFALCSLVRLLLLKVLLNSVLLSKEPYFLAPLMSFRSSLPIERFFYRFLFFILIIYFYLLTLSMVRPSSISVENSASKYFTSLAFLSLSSASYSSLSRRCSEVSSSLDRSESSASVGWRLLIICLPYWTYWPPKAPILSMSSSGDSWFDGKSNI